MRGITFCPFLADLLSSPHPYSFAVGRVVASETAGQWIAVHIAQLDFPDRKLVETAVRLASEQIKGPAMLWAGETCAEDDAKVLNVKGRPIGQRICVVRALLE